MKIIEPSKVNPILSRRLKIQGWLERGFKCVYFPDQQIQGVDMENFDRPFTVWSNGEEVKAIYDTE